MAHTMSPLENMFFQRDSYVEIGNKIITAYGKLGFDWQYLRVLLILKGEIASPSLSILLPTSKFLSCCNFLKFAPMMNLQPIFAIKGKGKVAYIEPPKPHLGRNQYVIVFTKKFQLPLELVCR